MTRTPFIIALATIATGTACAEHAEPQERTAETQRALGPGDVERIWGAPVKEDVGVRATRFFNYEPPHSTVWSSGINPERVQDLAALWFGLESNYQVAPGGHHLAEWYVQFYSESQGPQPNSGYWARRPIHGSIVRDGDYAGMTRTFSQADSFIFLNTEGDAELARLDDGGGFGVLRTGPGGYLGLGEDGVLVGQGVSGYRTMVRLDEAEKTEIGGGTNGTVLKAPDASWNVGTFQLSKGTCEERLATIEAGLIELGLATPAP